MIQGSDERLIEPCLHDENNRNHCTPHNESLDVEFVNNETPLKIDIDTYPYTMLAKDVTVQWNFISPCSCASSESTHFMSDSPIHLNQETMESLHTYTLSPQNVSPLTEWNDTKTIESRVRSLTEIDTVTDGYTAPCTEYMVRNDTIAAWNCEDITTTTLISLPTTYFSNNSCNHMKENDLIEVENGSNRTNSHTKSDTSSIEENVEGDFSSDDEDYNGESNRWSKASSLPSRFSVKSMQDSIRTSVADLNRFRVQSQSKNWKPRSVPFGSAFLSRDLPISSIKDMRQKATQCASKAADYIHTASSQATTTLKRHATLPKIYKKESFFNSKRRSTDETQTVACPEDIEIDHAEV